MIGILFYLSSLLGLMYLGIKLYATFKNTHLHLQMHSFCTRSKLRAIFAIPILLDKFTFNKVFQNCITHLHINRLWVVQRLRIVLPAWGWCSLLSQEYQYRELSRPVRHMFLGVPRGRQNRDNVHRYHLPVLHTVVAQGCARGAREHQHAHHYSTESHCDHWHRTHKANLFIRGFPADAATS